MFVDTRYADPYRHPRVKWLGLATSFAALTAVASPVVTEDQRKGSVDGSSTSSRKTSSFKRWFNRTIRPTRAWGWLIADKSFFIFKPEHWLRRTALRLVQWRWFERLSLLVILTNCLSVAMFNPCEDNLRFQQCKTEKCRNLRLIDVGVSAFFFFEMLVKMLSHCAVGHRRAYLADPWNRLDFVIVVASFIDYVSFEKDEDATASDWTLIRVIRVLRPIRAIKRIPSLRLLVTLLCDALPALTSIIALIIFVYFIFGIIGIQLWAGDLRNRCFLTKPSVKLGQNLTNTTGQANQEEAKLAESEDGTLDYFFQYDYFFSNSTDGPANFSQTAVTAGPFTMMTNATWGDFSSFSISSRSTRGRVTPAPTAPQRIRKTISMPLFYESPSLDDYVCGGFLSCSTVEDFEKRNSMCETLYQEDDESQQFCSRLITNYNKCKPSDANPFDGGVSFDNIIIAFITIFQAASPEGWSEIMYTIQDAYSFWAWPYFLFLIVAINFGVSSFSFVVVAIQIPKTKQRLAEKMRREELRAKMDRAQSTLSQWFETLGQEMNNQRRLSVLLARQEDEDSDLEAELLGNGGDIYELQNRNFYTLLVDITVDYVRKVFKSLKFRWRNHFKRYNFTAEKVSSPPTIWRKIRQAIRRSRRLVRDILNHILYGIATTGVIIAATVSMGLEHHNEPKWLTSMVDQMNLAFTVVFTLELLLKFYALGFVEYIRNGFNMLDMVIVVISVSEIVTYGRDGSGLSVLRTFRLLRIFKILRFSTAMQNQLLAMFRTINSVAPFLLLFGLFVFIFVILGVLLFGCEFCNSTLTISNATVLQTTPSPSRNFGSIMADQTIAGACKSYNKRRQDNFYTLLDSLLTVLRILTQDDGWSQVLRDTMFYTSSYWPAAYFICLLLFGNYVLLSMLLAIIDVGSSPTANKIIKETPGVDFTSLISLTSTGKLEQTKKTMTRLQRHRRMSYSKAIKRLPLPLVRSSSLDEDRCSVRSYRVAIERQPLSTPKFPQRRISALSQRAHSSSRIDLLSTNASNFAFDPDDGDDCTVALLSNERISSTSNDNFGADFASACDDLSIFSSVPSSPVAFPRRDVMLAPDNPAFVLGGDESSSVTESFGEVNEAFETDQGGKPNRIPELRNRIKGLIAARIAFTIKKTSEVLNAGEPQNQNATTQESAAKPLPPARSPSELAEELLNQGLKILNPLTLIGKLNEKPKPNDRNDYSLYLFSNDNPLRKFLKWLVLSPRYDNVLLFIVVLNCIAVTFERPSITSDSLERDILDAANFFFTGIFFTEAVFKIIALGFVIGCGSYLHSGWNVLDFVLVILSIIDFGLDFQPQNEEDGDDVFRAFRSLRLLRAFKPLRAINRRPGLRTVTRMLSVSVKSIANVFIICLIFFVAFAVLGLQLFKGTYYHCAISTGTVNHKINHQLNMAALMSNSTMNSSAIFRSQNDSITLKRKPISSMAELKGYLENVKNRSDCLAVEGLQWRNEPYNFDNFPNAFMTLMVVATFDGWIEITENGIDAVDIDQQPIENYAPWRMVYFLAFITINAFCVVEMFVGVIVNNYKHMRAHLVQEVDTNLAMNQRRGALASQHPEEPLGFWLEYPSWRRKLFHICNHVYLDAFFAVLILANVFVMAIEHYQMSMDTRMALRMVDYCFIAIFLMEIGLKVVAFGPKHYIGNKWHRLDVVVILLSIIDLVLDEIEATREVPFFEPGIIRIVRIFRVVRTLKIFKVSSGVHTLLQTLRHTLPKVGNMSLLFLLIFFIYAALGVELLGRLHCPYNSCEGLSRHANFHNFGMAMLTLFRVSTGDNWKAILDDSLELAADPNTRCFGPPLVTNVTTVISELDKYNRRVANKGANSTVQSSLAQGSTSFKGTGGGVQNDCGLVTALAPVYFTSFFVITQFFLVNVVVACLMHHLEEVEKQGLLERNAGKKSKKNVLKRSAAEYSNLQKLRLECHIEKGDNGSDADSVSSEVHQDMGLKLRKLIPDPGGGDLDEFRTEETAFETGNDQTSLILNEHQCSNIQSAESPELTEEQK